MDSETPFTALAPPVFKGEGYQIWATRMEARMEANDVWEAVEEDYEVPSLPANPTMAQIKNQKEKKIRKSKARATLFAAVSSEIFVRIMTVKSAFEMKDSETIIEYSDRLLNIANNVRLLGSECPDSKLVQKILLTVPERTIEFFPGTRTEKAYEGDKGKEKWNKKENSGFDSPRFNRGTKHDFPPCKHCGKKGHPPFKCWRRPDQQCEKCQNMGHHQKICKNDTQQNNAAHVANQEDEEQLFVATYFATSSSSDKWLIDNGCTNHMKFDRDLFKELDTSVISKEQVGNGEYLPAKGKGTVEIKSSSGTKLIKDVFLYLI
ncbi:uncharacterized protein LOC132613281 [Lycium barbarum]|uniref:uncharacterized protein LOC132613281 n=1 Tax=Lycium barbarum TaxID=112863 RepID=UPI00293F44D2|nr:uncharacterized protein LOC132613281 [Lycium barbarum]